MAEVTEDFWKYFALEYFTIHFGKFPYFFKVETLCLKQVLKWKDLKYYKASFKYSTP